MSGTAYGTIVLHVAPEAAIGGPLALVETGDFITLDLPSRTLDVEVAKRSCDADGTAGVPRSEPLRTAATRSCSANTCYRRTGGWTSISWLGGAATPCPPSLISAFAGPLNSVAGTALVFGVVFGGARRGWLQGPVHAP